MMRGISDGAPALARGDTSKFQNAVALRVNPPRSGTGNKAPKNVQGAPKAPKALQAAATPAKPEPTAEDTRTPLQKLADKFR
jgi:PTH1 family peptidyl-tRNA hydrolase